ncbi:MAG: hypothetical protein GEU71_00455 [Actinobacteria bacterium]|nr:hypothetical protein [Actinomycetota bacterium]
MANLIWGFLTVVATIVVALFGAKIPATFWDDRRVWFVGAVVVLALSSVRTLLLNFIGQRSLAQERRVQDALKTAYVQIVELSGIDYRDVGLHAFLVRGYRLRPWRKRLVRVGRWRLKSTPPVTGIEWTRGKGLIGRCWELRQNVGANLAEEWGFEELDESEWESLEEAVRYGFSYDEYLRVRAYGAVVAVPILDDAGGFIGCVSADAPGETYDLIWTEEVLGALHDAGLWIEATARKTSRT